jgi:undecaprenyl-diphosphatase
VNLHEITWWQAIILGLAQGLTEFLPVSSSAHLNILHALFGHPRELTYDLSLHIGTLIALAWYYHRDWIALLTKPEQRGLRNLVFIACVPAVVLGVIGRDWQDHPPISLPQFNATMLIVFGLLLWFSDRAGRKEREVDSVNLTDAIVVGCAQAIALLPGVSRSGSTITAGLFRGFTREAAARFSFLMSLPITLGAVVYEVYGKVIKGGGLSALDASPIAVLLGIVVSAASGFWAIGFLLNFLKRRDVTPFVVWRIAVALAVFGLALTGLFDSP